MPDTDFTAAGTQDWHRADAAGFMLGGTLAILRERD
jgi:hypothetical protein